MSLIDLFLDDYNCNCRIVIYKNEIDENGKNIISNELNSVGRFFESGSLEQDTRTQGFLANAELYVPCDVDPTQRVVTNGICEINGVEYKIVKCQKADIFNEINFTRMWLK